MQPSSSASSRRWRPVTLLAAVTLLVVSLVAASCSEPAAAPEKPAWAIGFPGDRSVGVEWGAAAQHDDVSSYVATTEPGGRTCTTTTKMTCTLTGLTNGTAYTVSIVAVGDGGKSAPVQTKVTAGTPWPASAVVAAPGDASATLTWKAPLFAPGAPVTSYTASSYPPGGTCASFTTTCTVSGLVNGTTYAFVVVAHNANGASLPSPGSPGITPSDTAGGSPGIVYLGPVNASQETSTGTILQRDAGISVALPNGRDLWIFGDTSSFSADAGQSEAFIGGSTAAKGRYVPGKTPDALKDVQPAGSSGTTTAPAQFIPTPTDTYMPDGSGRACTPANGAIYTARWPTGAALLTNQKQLLVTYSDVCVTSTTSFTVEGWGFMTYSWRVGKIVVPPYDVFTPSPQGTALPPDRTYQSPIVANGNITFFTSSCTTLFVACSSGTVSATTVADNLLALGSPASYVNAPAVTDGSAPWMPVNISVAAYPTGLRLIEQTSIGGTFIVFSSISPTGPWHPFYSGTLPGCSTTPRGFCYAFVGHPELGSATSLIVSYFKPDSLDNANVGHVDLALVPLP
jgi:hypothetical protein